MYVTRNELETFIFGSKNGYGSPRVSGLASTSHGILQRGDMCILFLINDDSTPLRETTFPEHVDCQQSALSVPKFREVMKD